MIEVFLGSDRNISPTKLRRNEFSLRTKIMKNNNRYVWR